MIQVRELDFLDALIRGKLRIFGGEGDGDDASGDAGKDDDKPGDSGPDSGDSGGDSGDAGGDAGEDPVKDLEAKLDAEKKLRIKLQRDLDKQNQEKEKQNEDVVAERDELKGKYDKLKTFVETGYLDTAIIKESSVKDKSGTPKYDWEDVEAVRIFIDKNNIRLDIETGQVEGLDMELKRIAKEKPYLLVKKQESEDAGAGGGGGSGPPSGSHPFGGSARQRETDKNKIGAKYKIPGFGPGSTVRPL
jgi:hypothetical protein